MSEFIPFPKIARLSREVCITEKLDGTNGLISIGESGEFEVGSRSTWITPEKDNFGFAAWAYANKEELLKLGPGRHFGEWWGQGIQRKYGMTEKVFSLFNVSKWTDDAVRPACCRVVPILGSGIFTDFDFENVILQLIADGSKAAPGFLNPEGIIIYHTQGNLYFKKTIHKDEEWKGKSA